jgi:hypothetical protein
MMMNPVKALNRIGFSLATHVRFGESIRKMGMHHE